MGKLLFSGNGLAVPGLYEYCEAHDIPHERCGKLILATGPHELARLSELERRGNANGVRGLRRIVADELASIEPHARAIEGLHSPDTGIVDFAAVARSYARDVEEAGGTITTGWEIAGVEAGARALRLSCAGATIEAGHAIFCGGAWADRLATADGLSGRGNERCACARFSAARCVRSRAPASARTPLAAWRSACARRRGRRGRRVKPRSAG